MKYTFGDIVVVDKKYIGVIVKSWSSGTHEVYVRDENAIMEYKEEDIERYLVRHKELSKKEQEYQFNATHNL
jgi:hypothetical protein